MLRTATGARAYTQRCLVPLVQHLAATPMPLASDSPASGPGASTDGVAQGGAPVFADAADVLTCPAAPPTAGKGPPPLRPVAAAAKAATSAPGAGVAAGSGAKRGPSVVVKGAASLPLAGRRRLLRSPGPSAASPRTDAPAAPSPHGESPAQAAYPDEAPPATGAKSSRGADVGTRGGGPAALPPCGSPGAPYRCALLGYEVLNEMEGMSWQLRLYHNYQ
jgi:hypothetical protein